MGYEMEFCKASREELIFIAKIVYVMLEKQPVYKRVPCQWSETFGNELVNSFFLLKKLKKTWFFPPGEKL